MEIERNELKVVAKKKHVILDTMTLLEKGIKILDPKHSCGHKQNKIMISMLSRRTNWKDIVEEENCASKVGLVLLFSMD
jgi:hypothetical protein